MIQEKDVIWKNKHVEIYWGGYTKENVNAPQKR